MASVQQQPEQLVVAEAVQTVVETCQVEAVEVGPSVGEALQGPCEPKNVKNYSCVFNPIRFKIYL